MRLTVTGLGGKHDVDVAPDEKTETTDDILKDILPGKKRATSV